ncbi:MAG: NAD+ synthase [SAR202 cluster bacterium]|nr:NAD+ synthase [SAR202 cluster bacterium]
MRSFRLALAQMNPTVGDLQGNANKILEIVELARSNHVDLVAFPELAICGYPPEDLLLQPSFLREIRDALTYVMSASGGISLVVGFVDQTAEGIYNAAALGSDGHLIDVYHKLHLPNYGVFDEVRYFSPGRVCPVYQINGFHVGINICEDIWFADGPTSLQASHGAELIVNINGSPFFAGKRLSREDMLSTRALDNSVFVAYVNMVGGQDELVFDGGSMIFGPDGQLISRATQFHEDLLVTDLDLSLCRSFDPRPEAAILSDQSATNPRAPKKIFVNGPSSDSSFPKLLPRIETPLDPIGEIYQALVIGTRDYVNKNRFEHVVISLSGGIDSTLTCCVAVDALGKERVSGVAMPSRFSSDESVSDSLQLAHNLGIPCRVLPIESAHQAFESILKELFDGTEPNVAEQNLQARIRGNLLMALSNKFGWLALTTGNKSEMAMGYATLYGDMAGGFAVLKDVSKTLVYELSYWRNNCTSARDIIPETILSKPPSAELKPNQRDDDDLPPYPILDQALTAYVEQDKSFEEMVASGFDSSLVTRVIRTVERNEFKRRQSPIGVKITPRAFGRDRRMPIVNRYTNR